MSERKKKMISSFWNIDLSDGVHQMRAPKTEAHGAASFRVVYILWDSFAEATPNTVQSFFIC